MATTTTLRAGEGVRKLAEGDYGKGYTELLSKLTTVGDVSEEDFRAQLHFLETERGGDYCILVVEDEGKSRIMGTGTLLVEHKFIHACGSVGHIEDIVVLPEARGQGLGHRVVAALIKEAGERGCYKVILDCAEKNVGFYEKVGMERKEVQMVKYL